MNTAISLVDPLIDCRVWNSLGDGALTEMIDRSARNVGMRERSGMEAMPRPTSRRAMQISRNTVRWVHVNIMSLSVTVLLKSQNRNTVDQSLITFLTGETREREREDLSPSVSIKSIDSDGQLALVVRCFCVFPFSHSITKSKCP